MIITENKIAFIISENRHYDFLQPLWDRLPEGNKELIINDFRRESYHKCIESAYRFTNKYYLASKIIGKKKYLFTIDYGATCKRKLILDKEKYKKRKNYNSKGLIIDFIKVSKELIIYTITKLFLILRRKPKIIPERYFLKRRIKNPFLTSIPLAYYIGENKIYGDDSLDNLRKGWPWFPVSEYYDIFLCVSPLQKKIISKLNKKTFLTGYIRYANIKKRIKENTIVWYLTDDTNKILQQIEKFEGLEKYQLFAKIHPDYYNRGREDALEKIINRLKRMNFTIYSENEKNNKILEFADYIIASNGAIKYTSILFEKKLILMDEKINESEYFHGKLKEFHILCTEKDKIINIINNESWLLYEKKLLNLKKDIYGDLDNMEEINQFICYLLNNLKQT